MELSRGEILYNEAAIRFNDLLRRYQVLRADNARLRRELAEVTANCSEWRQAFYRGREKAE